MVVVPTYEGGAFSPSYSSNELATLSGGVEVVVPKRPNPASVAPTCQVSAAEIEACSRLA
jgi:hypothetical protein